MVNLATLIEALKLTWIKRLLQSDSKWQDFIKNLSNLTDLSRVQYRIYQEGIDKYILRDIKNTRFYILCLFHMIDLRMFSLLFLILLQNGP